MKRLIVCPPNCVPATLKDDRISVEVFPYLEYDTTSQITTIYLVAMSDTVLVRERLEEVSPKQGNVSRSHNAYGRH